MYLDLTNSTWYTPVVTGKIPMGRRSHSACKFTMVHFFAKNFVLLCINLESYFASFIAFKR